MKPAPGSPTKAERRRIGRMIRRGKILKITANSADWRMYAFHTIEATATGGFKVAIGYNAGMTGSFTTWFACSYVTLLYSPCL